MRKYLILALLGLFSAACDSSEDLFEEKNKAPEIFVKSQYNSEFTVDFIDSLKIENSSYTFEYKIADEQEGLIGVFACENETSTIQTDSSRITLTPSQLGENKITLSTTDAYGVQGISVVNIVAFDNLAPVARVKVVEEEALLSPFERKIDASESFDQDAKFGGEVVEYEFRIENEAIIQTSKNFINYIFPQAGSYKIKVRVKDSNNAWSETTTIIPLIR